MKPLVSVNIVSFNSEKFIAKSILSVLKQNFKRWEIIIVDNGSTDKTIKIIKEFIKKNNNIKLFKLRKPNQPKARNIAIKYSSASFIAVLDSDDECENNRLEIQYKFMKDNKKVNFLGSFTNIIDEKDNFLYQNNYPVESNLIKFSFLFGNPIAHSTLMFRKNFNNFYDEKLKFSQDREMLTRNINNNNYSNIPLPLVKFRVHKDQINKEKIKIQKINEFNNLKRNYQILFNKSLQEKYIDTIISTRYKKKCSIDQLILLSEYILNSHNLFEKKLKDNFEIKLITHFSKKKYAELSSMCSSNIFQILNVYIKNTKLFSSWGILIIISKKVLSLIK